MALPNSHLRHGSQYMLREFTAMKGSNFLSLLNKHFKNYYFNYFQSRRIAPNNQKALYSPKTLPLDSHNVVQVSSVTNTKPRFFDENDVIGAFIPPIKKYWFSSQNKTNVYIKLSAILTGSLLAWMLRDKKVSFAEKKDDSIDEDKIIQAVEQGNLETLKKILNKENYENVNTALLISAASCNQLKILQWLLAEGITGVDERDANGITALLAACRRGHKEIAEWLLMKGGAKITEKDQYGRTALMTAVDYGNKELVEWLIIYGKAKVNEKNKRGDTALLYAAARSEELFEVLLSHEAKITTNNNGENVLMVAAKAGNKKMVEWVIRKKYAAVSSRNNEGSTALLIACNHGHKEVAEFLLTEGGASITERDGRGRTALIRATDSGNKQLVEWLLTHSEANVTEKSNYGETPLLYAAARGHQDLFKFLLSKGAQITVTNEDLNVLMLAAQYGHKKMVEWLLAKKFVKITDKDNNGVTAFLHAVNAGQLEIAKLLLSKGACFEDKSTKGGKTALLIATEGESPNGEYLNLVKFLLDNGAKISETDDLGCTPLIHVITREEVDHKLVKFLLDNGADVNKGDKDGTTALHYAVAKNDPELVKLLLIRKANVHAKDLYGTPLDILKKDLYHKYSYQAHSNKHNFDIDIIDEHDEHDEENVILDKDDQAKLRIDQRKHKIREFLLDVLEEDVERKDRKLDEHKKKIDEDNEKAMRAVVSNFRRILSEKISVTLYTDRAIWSGTAKSSENNFDKLLEIAQIVSATSGDMAIRIAANLGAIYIKGNIDDYRQQKTAYVQRFGNKSISEDVRAAAKMIAKRYEAQLLELSVEGLEDFAQYFHDKLIEHLRVKYKNGLVNNNSEKATPIELELFEIMINPAEGRSITLQKRSANKENKEVNRDKENSWESRELVKRVGIIIAGKYIEGAESPQTLYELKPTDEKYGRCTGSKSDVSDLRFQRCAFWLFGCAKPKASDLRKYSADTLDETTKLRGVQP